MLIVRLDDWKNKTNWNSIDDEAYKKALEIWPGANPQAERPYKASDGRLDPYYQTLPFPQPMRITMDEAAKLEALGLRLDYLGIHGTMLTKMRDRDDWQRGDSVQASDLMRGSAVQLTVADIGLLMIDEVDWIEDACTEALQARLDDGWRILAVCPPNAKRRPDYILGRRKKE